MPMSDDFLAALFTEARTHHAWLDRPVDEALLKQAYDLAKWGPTSTNCCPLRIVFVASKEAKEWLKPALDAGNVAQTMAAPVTAVFGSDMAFYERLPYLSPHNNAAAWFTPGAAGTETAAFRNATLQAAYFMLAARALGLDCGPMSGFNNAKVDEAFFAGTKVKSNFLCNLGYGDASKLHPRAPRLGFGDACRIE